MTLIFNIEYRTSWGEEVRVLGSIPELGNNQPNKATPLHLSLIHISKNARKTGFVFLE